MKDKVAIICVDDEVIILQGLKSQLRKRFGRAILIETVESGGEALELYEELMAEDYVVPVVISDQIMPGLKGDELLIKFYEINPEMKFILLTGQASPDAVGNALNKANLFRYISKPWEVDDLNITVNEAINSYFQLKEIEQKEADRQRLLEELKEANATLERKVQERTKELNLEKQKSEKLLLNILPEEVVQELKMSGISSPKHFDQVSVIFTDFKGFTKVAARMRPKDLVGTLNECFSAFDEIVEKYNLEKIKTIGDAYMCVGGVPIENSTNAKDAIEAAKEMIDWVENWNKGKEEDWEIRIGIHTGELVAGVIGSKKFAYDVWGDAVNIANRIEAAGEPGKINVSASTFELVKNHFKGNYRGEIEVKNRGSIGMYFVN
jgi:class 3 adenylate cyclase